MRRRAERGHAAPQKAALAVRTGDANRRQMADTPPEPTHAERVIKGAARGCADRCGCVIPALAGMCCPCLFGRGVMLRGYAAHTRAIKNVAPQRRAPQPLRRQKGEKKNNQLIGRRATARGGGTRGRAMRVSGHRASSSHAHGGTGGLSLNAKRWGQRLQAARGACGPPMYALEFCSGLAV